MLPTHGCPVSTVSSKHLEKISGRHLLDQCRSLFSHQAVHIAAGSPQPLFLQLKLDLGRPNSVALTLGSTSPVLADY